MKPAPLALMAALLSPLDAAAQSCASQWTALTCADETYQVTSWSEGIFVQSGFGPADNPWAPLAPSPSEPPVDLDISATLSAGDGAAVAIVDYALLRQTLKETHPDILAALDTAIVVCGLSPPDCKAALQPVFGAIPVKTYQDSSLWWAGCQKKSSQYTLQLPTVPPKAGYIVGATANAGSSAAISINVTHHSPRTQVATRCNSTSGAMPPDGTYPTAVTLGPAPPAPTAVNGGTLSNPTTRISSPVGMGTFSVSNGQVQFTGTVSRAACLANACPAGEKCCSPISRDGQCVPGCVANAVACQPECPLGGHCCGQPGPTGTCDGTCLPRCVKPPCPVCP